MPSLEDQKIDGKKQCNLRTTSANVTLNDCISDSFASDRVCGNERSFLVGNKL